MKLLKIHNEKGLKIYKTGKKRTNFKKYLNKPDIFTNPEKYLIYSKNQYSPEYIRQLKYILKKKYQNDNRRTQ